MLSQALLIAISLAAEAMGEQGRKPACGALTRGLMWPIEANANGQAAIWLSRQGKLEICMRGAWSYQWKTPVVHVKDLARDAGHRAMR